MIKYSKELLLEALKKIIEVKKLNIEYNAKYNYGRVKKDKSYGL